MKELALEVGKRSCSNLGLRLAGDNRCFGVHEPSICVSQCLHAKGTSDVLKLIWMLGKTEIGLWFRTGGSVDADGNSQARP